MSNPAVLLIHKKDKPLEAVTSLLEGEGISFQTVEDASEALKRLAPGMVVVADLNTTGDMAGAVLKKARRLHPEVPVVLIAENRDVGLAVEYMRQGAYHFVSRPLNEVELFLLIQKVLERTRLAGELASLRKQLDDRYGFERFLGQSEVILKVIQMIRQVAPTRSTVLLTGENGTGKELAAHAIHQNSQRKDFPFIVVNSVALSPHLVESELFGHVKGAFTGAMGDREGKFAAADGGTLFIDEIGDIEPAIQAKLLRVLENRTYTPVGSNEELEADVRVVAATNKDLEDLVAKGDFREDLYYRLNVIRIHLPPLRERAGDIALFVQKFIQSVCQENKIHPAPKVSPEALNRLRMYAWPGNVRQLRNTIESAVVLSRSSMLDVADFPPAIMDASHSASGRDFHVGMTMSELECEAIASTLKELDNNRTRSAKVLGISLRTLQRKIKEYGLS